MKFISWEYFGKNQSITSIVIENVSGLEELKRMGFVRQIFNLFPSPIWLDF
jgi:phage tail protein X